MWKVEDISLGTTFERATLITLDEFPFGKEVAVMPVTNFRRSSDGFRTDITTLGKAGALVGNIDQMPSEDTRKVGGAFALEAYAGEDGKLYPYMISDKYYIVTVIHSPFSISGSGGGVYVAPDQQPSEGLLMAFLTIKLGLTRSIARHIVNEMLERLYEELES